MQIKTTDLLDAAKQRIDLAFNNTATNNLDYALQGMLGELAYLRMCPNSSSRPLHLNDTGYDVIDKGMYIDVKVNSPTDKARKYNNRTGFAIEMDNTVSSMDIQAQIEYIFEGCDAKAIFHTQVDGKGLEFIGYAFRHTPIESIRPAGDEGKYYVNYNTAQLWKLK